MSRIVNPMRHIINRSAPFSNDGHHWIPTQLVYTTQSWCPVSGSYFNCFITNFLSDYITSARPNNIRITFGYQHCCAGQGEWEGFEQWLPVTWWSSVDSTIPTHSLLSSRFWNTHYSVSIPTCCIASAQSHRLWYNTRLWSIIIIIIIKAFSWAREGTSRECWTIGEMAGEA